MQCRAYAAQSGWLAVLGCAFLLAAVSEAQTVRPGPRVGDPRLREPVSDVAAGNVRIRKFAALGGRSVARTPEYKTNLSRGVNPPAEWIEVVTTYETKPAWIDDLAFQYYVLMETAESGRSVFALLKTAVRYSDIAEGRGHISSVFVHPKAVKRYGQPVAAAVEILIDGKVVASEHETSKKLPESWWKNPLVVESKDVTVRDGYLLDRSQSPFALINMDDYEFVK